MEMLLSLWKRFFGCPLAFYEDPPGGGGQSPEPSPAATAGQDPPPGGDNPVNQDPPPEPPPEPPADLDYEAELSRLIEERGHKGVILEIKRKTEDLTKAHEKVKELEGTIQKNRPFVNAGEKRTIAKDAIEAYRKKMEELQVDQRYIDATIELAGNLSQGFTPEETARIRKNVYGGDLDETINKLKNDPDFKLHITRLEPEFRKLATTIPAKFWGSTEVMSKYLGELAVRNPIRKGGGAPPPPTPPTEPHRGPAGAGGGVKVTDAEVRKYAEENGQEIPSQAVFEKVRRSLIAERQAEINRQKYIEARSK